MRLIEPGSGDEVVVACEHDGAGGEGTGDSLVGGTVSDEIAETPDLVGRVLGGAGKRSLEGFEISVRVGDEGDSGYGRLASMNASAAEIVCSADLRSAVNSFSPTTTDS